MPRINYNNLRDFVGHLPVVNADKQVVRFGQHPRPGQLRFLALLEEREAKHKPPWFLVDKSRRTGISTVCIACLVAHCAAFENADARITAHVKETGDGLFHIARIMQEGLVKDGLISAPKPTARIIQFSPEIKGAKITVGTAKTASGGRGLGFSALLATEAAFYEKEESFLSLLSAGSVTPKPGFFTFIESTANGSEGVGEPFYNLWMESVHGQSDFAHFFLGPQDDPDCCVKDEEQALDLMSRSTGEENEKEEKALKRKFNLNLGQLAWRRLMLVNKCAGELSLLHQEYPYCLVANTYISTNGGFQHLAMAMPGEETESGPVTGLLAQGIAPVFRVTTEAGRIVTGTGDHPLEKSDGRFVLLDESLGTVLALRPPRFSDKPHTARWRGACGSVTELRVDEEFARFLGLFMGDGSFCGAGARSKPQLVSIACDAKDADVVAEVERLFDKFFGRHYTRITGDQGGCREVRVNCIEFQAVMRHLGIYREERPHRLVCVPWCILRSPQSIVREFLRGLFEADGFNGHRYNRVTLYSKHVEFLRQVQLLLLGFAITSRVRSRQTTKKDGYTYTANTLDLRATEAWAFHDTIGFIGERKNNRHKHLNTRYGSQRKPIVFEDRVVSVEPAGEQRVYDLSIDDHRHTFSANGIIVHNTWEESFIRSGFPAFTEKELSIAEQSVKDAPVPKAIMLEAEGNEAKRHIHSTNRRGPYLVFVPPVPGHAYYIGVDAARGEKQGDFSAAVVWDGHTGESVCTFVERASVDQFADLLDRLGRWYSNTETGIPAMMNIEVSCHLGNVVWTMMRDKYHYPHWYQWRGKDDRLHTHRPFRAAVCWETTQYTREMMMGNYRVGLNQYNLAVLDKDLYSQMARANIEFGKWEVRLGHDDLLVAAMIGWITRTQWPPAEMGFSRVGHLTEAAQPREDAKSRPAVLTNVNDLSPILEAHWRKVTKKPDRTHVAQQHWEKQREGWRDTRI